MGAICAKYVKPAVEPQKGYIINANLKVIFDPATTS